MGNVTTQDETPTRPTERPVLTLENDMRTVRTNSVEHDRLVDAGWIVIEHDDRMTILRRGRRVGDQAQRGDTARHRDVERGVLEQVAAELNESRAGGPLDGAGLRWAFDECRRRIMRETDSPRTVVSGRLR